MRPQNKFEICQFHSTCTILFIGSPDYTIYRYSFDLYSAFRAVEKVNFLSHFFLVQLMISEESFIRSEYTRLWKNEQKECQILRSRLLSVLVLIIIFILFLFLNFYLGLSVSLCRSKICLPLSLSPCVSIICFCLCLCLSLSLSLHV